MNKNAERLKAELSGIKIPLQALLCIIDVSSGMMRGYLSGEVKTPETVFESLNTIRLCYQETVSSGDRFNDLIEHRKAEKAAWRLSKKARLLVGAHKSVRLSHKGNSVLVGGINVYYAPQLFIEACKIHKIK